MRVSLKKRATPPNFMKDKFGYQAAWLILLAIAALAAAVVFIPIWLIKPFSPQTERQIEISYLLRHWSPLLTALFSLFAVGLVVYIWKNSRRWFGRAAVVVPLLIVFAFTWLARQNHFEWMFSPLESAKYAPAGKANFIADDEMVMAVKINGEAVAYPVRLMAYHHDLQDVVGGAPITATY